MTDQAILYQQYNTWQVEKGQELMNHVELKSGLQVLDVGCGTGELTYSLARAVIPNGKVVGVDPDNARLALAKKDQPIDLINIAWIEESIESVKAINAGTIDVVFANFSLHWVIDKAAALKTIRILLKPGGLFIMNTIVMRSDIITDLADLAEEFRPAHRAYIISSEAEWLSMLEQYNFKVTETWDVTDCVFENLDAFLIFWEGTSQGKFRREMLSEEAYKILLNKYPDKISMFGLETLSLSAIKC